MLYARAACLAAVALLVALELRDEQFAAGIRAGGARFRRNLAFAAASIAVMIALPAVGRAVAHLVRPPLLWPTSLLSAAACVLVAELLGWLLHYVKHWNGFLWLFHFQHHRESRYDLWLTAHTHALEVLVSGTLLAAALAFLGFPEPIVEGYLLFYSFVKLYQHSSRPYRAGWLDRVVIGPEYHRLHHEVGSRCNYGVTLTFWDLVFGTAVIPHRGRAERPYGPDSGQLPFGFWAETLLFLRAAARRVPAVEAAPLEALPEAERQSAAG